MKFLESEKKSTSEREQEVLAYWEENNIFEKSIEQRSEESLYTFYDGPPFATGLPHYGHIVASTIKDVVPRYWTMRGKRVPRVWGWDCHGLPIENIVEKELGSKSKKDIEEMGVAKFNEICRTKVLEYAGEGERIIPRTGRWVDMKNAYRTMDKDFMESVWWVFKDIYDKGLVYEDYRAMHICPRCETTLSQSEVTEGYADVKDMSVTAKFELVDDSVENEKTYALAWTTTPWTLPGNVALAVGGDIEYVLVSDKYIQPQEDIVPPLGLETSDASKLIEDKYILAKNQFENHRAYFKSSNPTIIKGFKGSALVGKSYKPLWGYYADDESLKNRENGWKIYAADFIDDESGTGIAHEAPAFGADDMAFGKEHDLPWVQHVGMDGVIKSQVTDFAGLNVKPAGEGKDAHMMTDIAIVKNLAHSGLLFRKEKYEHSYPHCWRCDTPLLNYATSSWFVNVTKLKGKFLEDAKDINWSPEHIKSGRWGKWLEGARDWSISRQRFWASVMPIWQCSEEGCDAQEVFGSAADLERRSGAVVDDLHKHIVDEVTFECVSCDGMMRRVPDVLDTWFDSGSMPYAQMHYPSENKETFEKNFPADFISEGVDQTRCWFYYMHVLAAGVMEKNAFQNVIVNGTVLAEDGKKMSKKLQNYPDPMEVIERHGADALRLYLMSSPVVAADNLRFSEDDLGDVSRGFMRMLSQSHSFFLMYASVDGWEAPEVYTPSKNALDRWVIAQLHILIRDARAAMDVYDLQKTARLFTPFVDDLSNWYIRRSRGRFWKSDDSADKDAAYETLHHILTTLARVIAPFCPFYAETLYRSLTEGESVHLTDYPETDSNLIDEDLLVSMDRVRQSITEALQLRTKIQIKVRQPLASATIPDVPTELAEIAKEELNVREIIFGEKVAIDTNLTEDLRVEGRAREIIRAVQQARKKAGYNVDDRIALGYTGMEDVFAAHGELIAHEILAVEMVVGDLKTQDYAGSVQIDGEVLAFGLCKA